MLSGWSRREMNVEVYPFPPHVHLWPLTHWYSPAHLLTAILWHFLPARKHTRWSVNLGMSSLTTMWIIQSLSVVPAKKKTKYALFNIWLLSNQKRKRKYWKSTFCFHMIFSFACGFKKLLPCLFIVLSLAILSLNCSHKHSRSSWCIFCTIHCYDEKSRTLPNASVVRSL